MKKFIEKLIGSLEEEKNETYSEMTLLLDKEYLLPCNMNQIDMEEYRCSTFEEVISIVNQLAEEYNGGWIPCSEKLPPHSDDLLLIQCSGKPKNNIIFDNAFCLASYTEEGWILEMYPEWKDAEVVAWMPLPELFNTKGE